MRRELLGLTLLLASVSGLAWADYVVIMVNLNEADKEEANQQGGQPGMPGMPGGMPGMPGGRPGGGPGGVGPGGIPGGGQQGGIPGGGQQGGMGALGAQGGRGPGMGAAGGMPPGMGAMGGMPGMGMRGVPPGMGAMGAMGMMGARGGGLFPGMGGQTLDIEDVPEFVVAIVEVNDIPKGIFKGMDRAKEAEISRYSVPVKHRWGKSHVRATPWSIITFLSQDGKSVESKRLPTVAQRYDEEFKKTFTSDRTDPNLAMDMARWTLQHGLVDKMPAVMKKVSESDSNHPGVKAFQAIHEKLEKPPEADPAGASWRTKLLEGYRVAEDAKHHFALVHGSNVSDEIVQTHLDNLENTFRGYYYWFALQGEALTVPKYRPIAILAKTDDDFTRLHKVLTSGPIVVDGFFARRENSAVFAPTRRDLQYRTLEEFNNQFWKNGFNQKDILRGKKNAGYPRGTEEAAIHVVQTLALVQQALEYEALQTTVSHDGSRQMLYVSDLLPPGVAAPEWLLFGMGSFFETSLQSPWATIAAPSPYYLPRFRDLQATKQLEPTSLETLKKVVTDNYFRNLPPRGEEKSTARQVYEASLRKARATTWALTYFLAWKHLPELRRYMAELSKMPRDMQLNEKVLWLTFARAFDAVDGDKVDEAKLQRLSVAWLSYIGNERFESEATMKLIRDKYREVLEKRKAKEEEKNKQGPGLPGMPGGRPGMPGMPGGMPGMPGGMPPGGFRPGGGGVQPNPGAGGGQPNPGR